MRSRLLLLAALALAVLPVRSEGAQAFSHPTLTDVLAALGDTTVPPAWAGVWQFDSADFECTTNDPLGYDSTVDTLCTGDEVNPSDLIPLTCTGTTDDTSINISCTGSGGLPPICTVDVTLTIVATRSENDMSATLTYTQVSTPPNCYGTDGCVRSELIGLRVAGEPAECANAVDPGTWGRLKSRYR